MAWVHQNNVEPTSVADAFYRIKEFLKNQLGGVITQSGGGANGCYSSAADPLAYAIVKTGGVDGSFDAGASSQTFTGDGYVETTMDVTTSHHRHLALAEAANGGAAPLGWDLYFTGTNLNVYEGGALVGTMGAWAPGDVIRIRRTGTTITYEQNGGVIYTSLVTTSAPLLIDSCIRLYESGLSQVKLVVGGVQTAITWSHVGTAAFNDGDLVRPATLVSRGWFAMTLPGGHHITIQPTISTNLVRVKISPSAGFLGGTPDCQTTPTATDEGVYRGSGTDASPVGLIALTSALNFPQYMQFVGDPETGAFVVHGHRSTSGGTGFSLCTMAWLFDPLLPGTYPTEDPHPFIFYATGSTQDVWSYTFLGSSSTNTPQGRGPDGVIAAHAALRYGTNAGIMVPAFSMANPYSTKDIAWPIIYGRDSTTLTSGGFKGRSSIIRWIGRRGRYGDRCVINGEVFINAGDVLIPWPDTATIPTLCAAEVTPSTLTYEGYMRGLNMTQATASAQPALVDGPVAGTYARDFDGTNDVLVGPTASTSDLEIAQGLWTVEAWIRPDSIGVNAAVIALAGTAATDVLSSNFALLLRIAATGKLEAFWEYDAGLNQQMLSTGAALVAGNWYRLAIVKTATHVRFFIDGVFQDQVAWTNNTNGATAAAWSIGVGGSPTGSDWFNGAIRDIQMSRAARSDVDISDRDAEALVLGEFPRDVYTYEGWRLGKSRIIDVAMYPEGEINVGGNYTVSGTWTQFVGDGSGIPVAIFEAETHRLLATAITAVGGSYTAAVPSGVREHYAVAFQDATHRGRSSNAYPV